MRQPSRIKCRNNIKYRQNKTLEFSSASYYAPFTKIEISRRQEQAERKIREINGREPEEGRMGLGRRKVARQFLPTSKGGASS